MEFNFNLFDIKIMDLKFIFFYARMELDDKNRWKIN